MDLYNTPRQLEKRTKRILEAEDISQRNKELIMQFKDRCFAEGLGDKRVMIYLVRLEHICKWLQKDLDKTTKEDIRMLVAITK